MFSINGCLAPGYTLAPPDKEEPDKQAVDDLLACLDDSDTTVPSKNTESPRTSLLKKTPAERVKSTVKEARPDTVGQRRSASLSQPAWNFDIKIPPVRCPLKPHAMK